MNQHETRAVAKILAHASAIGPDYAARALSALHRASLRAKARAAIVAAAESIGCTSSPEWIICN